MMIDCNVIFPNKPSIVTFGWEDSYGSYSWISITKNINIDGDNINTEDFVALPLIDSSKSSKNLDFSCYSDAAQWFRTPTEGEVTKLKNALLESKDSRSDKYLLDFFDIEKERTEFTPKPGDKVLVRGTGTNNIWVCDIFSYISTEGNYVCTGNLPYKECIPYLGNEYLIGTNKILEKNQK